MKGKLKWIAIGLGGLFIISVIIQLSKSPEQRQKEVADKVANDSLRKIQKVIDDSLEVVNKRKNMIREQFHPYDKSHRKLEKAIKESMNDPDSYEHIKTTYEDKGDYLIVQTSFRGKNAFGGKVINSKTVKVDLNGNIIAVIKE